MYKWVWFSLGKNPCNKLFSDVATLHCPNAAEFWGGWGELSARPLEDVNDQAFFLRLYFRSPVKRNMEITKCHLSLKAGALAAAGVT